MTKVSDTEETTLKKKKNKIFLFLIEDFSLF